MNIKNRLEGKPDRRYLVGLSQVARGTNKEKAKIITAAYLYELEHRNEMPKTPSYNPTVLFRLVLDFAKNRRDLLGFATKKYLDSIPLEEIYKHFRGVKNITPQDLPRLAELALERLSKERESSERILEDATLALFRPKGGQKTLRVDSFFDRYGPYNLNAERFTPEVLNYILTNLKKQNPPFFNEVIEKICKKLRYFVKDNIPLDEQEFNQKLKTVPPHEIGYFVRCHKESVFFHKIIKAIPELNTAYNEILKERQIEEERRRQELEFRREQKKNQLEKEERQKKEQANFKCDRLLEELAQLTVDNSLIDKQIEQARNFNMEELSKLLNPKNWLVIHFDKEGPISLSGLNNRVNDLLYNLYVYYIKRQQLSDVWNEIEKKLETLIKSAIIENKEKIYAVIDSRLSFVIENPRLDDCEIYLKNLKNFIKETKTLMESTEEENIRQFLQGIIDIAEKKLEEVIPIYENLKTQAEEEEKRKLIISIQENYLRDQTERQIDYLKEIYTTGTGLDLEDVEPQASSESGDVVGSTTLFLGPRLVLKPKLELSLKLEISLDNTLELEMGESLESIRKRMAMINWVIPHEIAHLVDLASDVHKFIFFVKDGTLPIKKIVDNWRGIDQDLARKTVPFVIKETTIDAIGYRLLKEYGSANPLDENQAERIASALRGYIAMMDVIQNILQAHARDKKTKSQYSVYLLRQIAVGEIMIEDSKINGVDEKIIKDAERTIEWLQANFNNFNQETHFIDEGQIKDIIEVCKYYFRKSERAPLVKRQEDNNDKID